MCEKNQVDNQDEWLNLGVRKFGFFYEYLTGIFKQGQLDASWDIMVLCSANSEDPDILHLGVSNLYLLSPEEQLFVFEGDSWNLQVVCSKEGLDNDESLDLGVSL